MAATMNHDVAGFVRRLRRFRYEWAKSASSNVAFVSQADADRLRSYLKGLMAYKSWFQSQPVLDLPESNPRTIDLGEAESLPSPENEAVIDMMVLWEVLEYELVHSQSSRLSSRLIEHDEKRVDMVLEKMSRFLEDYIMQIQPVDLPESVPLKSDTGKGRLGVNPGA